MTNLLQHLEPIQYEPNYIIQHELDEFGQIFFMIQGCIVVGFNINKTSHFALKKESSFQVGAFGLTFNQRCRYIYKSFRETTSGYFVRKEHWLDLLSGTGSEIKDFTKNFKKDIIFDYFMNIRAKLELSRKQLIAEFEQRADHTIILTTRKKEYLDDDGIHKHAKGKGDEPD